MDVCDSLSCPNSALIESVIYVRITDITDDGRLNDDIKKNEKTDDKYLLSDGDILFARTGATVGKTARYRDMFGRAIYAGFTELFNGVRNEKTPIIVERIVNDIDGIVKIVRFDGWQNTTEGQKEVKKALRSIIWIKYKLKNQEVFDQAYSYIEQYY